MFDLEEVQILRVRRSRLLGPSSVPCETNRGLVLNLLCWSTRYCLFVFHLEPSKPWCQWVDLGLPGLWPPVLWWLPAFCPWAWKLLFIPDPDLPRDQTPVNNSHLLCPISTTAEFSGHIWFLPFIISCHHLQLKYPCRSWWMDCY